MAVGMWIFIPVYRQQEGLAISPVLGPYSASHLSEVICMSRFFFLPFYKLIERYKPQVLEEPASAVGQIMVCVLVLPFLIIGSETSPTLDFSIYKMGIVIVSAFMNFIKIKWDKHIDLLVESMTHKNCSINIW